MGITKDIVESHSDFRLVNRTDGMAENLESPCLLVSEVMPHSGGLSGLALRQSILQSSLTRNGSAVLVLHFCLTDCRGALQSLQMGHWTVDVYP